MFWLRTKKNNFQLRTLIWGPVKIHYLEIHVCLGVTATPTDTVVPRPLTIDLWVFLFQTIDAEYVKWASPTGTYMYVKAFMINVNKRMKPFFLEQHITIVNRVTLQSFWFIFTCRSL